MKKINNLKKGILFAFLTSIISGIAIFYSKISIVKIPPLILTTSRNFYVGILFFLLFLITGRFDELKKLKKNDFIKLLLIGIIGGALPFYLFFTGLAFIKPQMANLIHKSLFIWVSILAAIFLREKFNRAYFLSFILIVLGNFYFTPIKLNLNKAELMIFAATILWSIENILAKKVLKNVSSELIGLFRMGVGGTILLITVILTGNFSKLSTINYQQLTIILLGGSILFFYVYFWYKALKYAPASLVTLILTFSTVIGNILNGVFAGVNIPAKDFYSSTIITLAIFIILARILLYGQTRFVSLRKIFNRP